VLGSCVVIQNQFCVDFYSLWYICHLE
jgi:hypothetical protein